MDATGGVRSVVLSSRAGSGAIAPALAGFRVRIAGGYLSSPGACSVRFRGSVSGCVVAERFRIPAGETVQIPSNEGAGCGDTELNDGLVLDLGDGWSPNNGSSSSSSGVASGTIDGLVLYQYIK